MVTVADMNTLKSGQPGSSLEASVTIADMSPLGGESDAGKAALETQGWMDMDAAFRAVGEYGHLQRKIVWLNALLMIALAYQQLQNVFLAAEPRFHCIPEKGELYLGCPTDGTRCARYQFPGDDFTSIASEWSLVCGQAYLASGVQSILMAGLFMGCLLVGNWADTYGRKRIFGASYAAMGIFAVLGAFSPTYWFYAAMRFCVGFACGGVAVVSFVLTSELVGQSQRGFLGLLFPVCFASGIAIFSMTAFLVREWRTLTVISALPGLIIVYLYRITPESPRWLYSKGRNQEAEAMLYKMAAGNRCPVTQEIRLHAAEGKAASKPVGVMDIIAHPILRARFLINIPIWFAFSAVYYGMTISAGSLGGSMYANVALSGISEIPGYLAAIYILKRLGRRVTLSGCLFLAGIPCLGILMLPAGATQIRLWMGLFGKMSVSVAFSVAYIYAAELFPTVLRNNAIGLCSTSARLGGILAPMLGVLNTIHPSLEYCVYGIFSLVAGGLALLLPDTTGKPLPETVEDLNNEDS